MPIGASKPAGFKEKSGALLCFLNPVLKQTGAGQVIVFITHIVSSEPDALRERRGVAG